MKGNTHGHRGCEEMSLFNIQLPSVIFGGAFGAASLTKHCAQRHHFLDAARYRACIRSRSFDGI
jgi:hypothetical protein